MNQKLLTGVKILGCSFIGFVLSLFTAFPQNKLICDEEISGEKVKFIALLKKEKE